MFTELLLGSIVLCFGIPLLSLGSSCFGESVWILAQMSYLLLRVALSSPVRPTLNCRLRARDSHLGLGLSKALGQQCLFVPPAQPCFTLFPKLQILRSSLIHFLHTHLHLRVQFLGHPTSLGGERTSCFERCVDTFYWLW